MIRDDEDQLDQIMNDIVEDFGASAPDEEGGDDDDEMAEVEVDEDGNIIEVDEDEEGEEGEEEAEGEAAAEGEAPEGETQGEAAAETADAAADQTSGWVPVPGLPGDGIVSFCCHFAHF